MRPYRAQDFNGIHAIDQACYTREIAYSKWEMLQYMGLPGADCLVAEHDGQMVGFILSAHKAGHGHIVTIDVLEAFRKAGVGTSLLTAAEKRMVERGCTQIVLETATNNKAAISFWKKHGYRKRGVLSNYYPGGIDAFAMSKDIPGSRDNDRRRKQRTG